MPTRLVNLRVKNISAVDKPANKRKWLVVKAAAPKSDNERRRVLEQAVRDKWGSASDWSRAYLADIFDGDAIIELQGVPYAVAFSFESDGRVTFEEPRRVTHAWVEKRRVERVEKVEWTTTYVNDLPDSAFAVISPGGKKDDDGKTVPRSLRHLPYRNAQGEADLPHLRNALARLSQIDASDADKAKARAKLQAAARAAGVGEVAEKMEHAMTFDDAMMRRRMHKVYEAIGDRYGALIETLNAVQSSDESDKAASLKQAVIDFADSMRAEMPRLMATMDEDDDDGKTRKAGRKISGARMSRLKAMRDMLTELITEAEEDTNMAEKHAPDANALTKIAHGIAAMFGRAAGADDETIAALEQAANPEPEIADEAARARITKSEADAAALRKSNEELATRLAKAEADVKAASDAAAKLRDEQELRKFADEVAGFRDVGLDPTKDAALLRDVEAKVGKEAADRLREVFKAQLAQRNASALFKEVGSTGAAGGAPESATAEVEQRIAAIVAKNATIDRAAAMDQVFREAPELYERVRRENLVKV